MYLHHSKVDLFGIPQVAFHFRWSENERRIRADSVRQAERLLKAAGAAYIVEGNPELMSEPGSGIHEMGTARMGNDPAQSVVNRFNQAHDIPNLFVTDGSFMTSASCVNPSLTYMAFTARAANYAVQQMSEGKI